MTVTAGPARQSGPRDRRPVVTAPPPRPVRMVPPMVLALRLASWRSPTATAGRLHHLLTALPHPADARVMADLHALQAEVLLQCADLGGALDASVAAARTAAELRPRDWPKLITALFIGADLAVWAGHPHAVAACDSTHHAFSYLDQPDPEREQIAAALHAVAVYHHTDAGHGLDLLYALALKAVPDGPASELLAAGLAAMRADRTGSHQPRHAVAAPVPGGLLQPRLDSTTSAYLASRVLAQPARARAAMS